MNGPRYVEACALLPMLHTPVQKNIVACVGPHAELLASDCLRWHDVASVILLEPTKIKDRRVRVERLLPAAGLDVLIVSPDVSPEPYLAALKPGGVANASTLDPEKTPGLLARLRKALPSVKPWREYLPEPMFGALVSSEELALVRRPPVGAVRISGPWLPCMFTFGRDEMKLVLPPPADPGPTPTM